LTQVDFMVVLSGCDTAKPGRVNHRFEFC